MKTVPLRAIAEVALGRQRSPKHALGPHMTTYLRAANVKDGYLVLDNVMQMNFDPLEQQRFGLSRGDVLVTEGAGSLRAVGASASWDCELSSPICFQNTLIRLRPRPETSARYLYWWARHAYVSGGFASLATGANIMHVGADRVRQMPVVPIEVTHQHQIADFLDRETERIDALIDKKRRLINVLEEKRTATITQAVTKGLDPTVPMKNSGIPWIGEVPDRWHVAPVYSRYHVMLGKMLSPVASSHPIRLPYLRNTNVRWDGIDMSGIADMHFDSQERVKFRLRRGDLLICEGGQVGRSAIWNDQLPECYFQKALLRASPLRGGESQRFLMYVLWAASATGVFENEGNQATFIHLTAEKLRAHRFGFPSHTEQGHIVNHLDTRRSRFDSLTARLTTQLSLLAEYREALITAAVTDEIDADTFNSGRHMEEATA